MKTQEEINELWNDVRKLMIEYAVNISTDESFEIMIGNKVIDILKDKYDLRLKKDIDKRFTEEDIIKAIEMAKEHSIGYYAPDSPAVYFEHTELDILQSLKK